MRWPAAWADPATLSLVKGTAVDTLLIDNSDEFDSLRNAARQAGLKVVHPDAPPDGVRLVEADMATEPVVPDGSLDLLVSSVVFEHVNRPVALLASVYLLMSMLWGGHFHVGYVWALPEGGYEFGVFWAAMIAVFVVLGGGPNSIDRSLWQSEAAKRFLPEIIRKILAS